MLKRTYSIDGFVLELDKHSMLPLFQKENPMYDRFIPYLGEIADKKRGVLIDIGANIGDTVAGIIKHTSQRIICIEPVKQFFELLTKNVRNFGVPYSSRCELVNACIAGDSESNFILEVKNGNARVKAHADDGFGDSETYTIPLLLKKKNIRLSDVSLIKVDTDGYDAECIMSIGEGLKTCSPVLFWENLFIVNNPEECSSYLSMYEYLDSCGYDNFFVFDNYGNYMANYTKKQLVDISDYMIRMRKKMSTLTFPYTDILACKPVDAEICTDAIRRYVKSFEH